ncbi:hypothetical protein [Streptomyces xiamenensis]|uniref:hypothetical protein n=1 Tax=Streptomyces xiamenensis TaxID=408015 RepID=UPI0035E32672
MVDQAALYGLMGALGGSIFGAGAAIAVPMLTQRYAKREKRRARLEDEFARVQKLRRATRRLQALLDPHINLRVRGADQSPFDDKAFRHEVDAALEAVEDAADELEVYGYRFVHSFSSERRSTPEGQALAGVTHWARELAAVTLVLTGSAEAVPGVQPLPPHAALQRNGGLPSPPFRIMFDRMDALRGGFPD